MSPASQSHRNSEPRRGFTVTFVLCVLIAIVALSALVGYLILGTEGDANSAGSLVHEVSRGTFLLDVVERGEVESSSNVEIRCEVKALGASGTTIIDVVEEGKYVQEGDILAQLDSSALEQDRLQQQIICNTSQSQVTQTLNDFETAKIAREEYVNGTFIQEEQEILNEKILAQESLRRADEYAQYSERLAAKGYVTALQLEGDQFAVEKANNELAAAKTKLVVLRDFTRKKMLTQLDSDVVTSEAKWVAARSSHKLDLEKLAEIDEQIEKCVIRAPQAGQVVYANGNSNRWSSGNEFVVEPGAMVRERQVLFRLPDTQHMQVKAKINESRIALFEGDMDMDVTIRLDAYDDLQLKGRIRHVNEYPEPTHRFMSQIKEYATEIEIFDSPPTIRPGLTAQVTIHAAEVQDVLQIPVQALYRHGPFHFVVARRPSGWETFEVQLGLSNTAFVIVEQGLTTGEVVSMNPRADIDKSLLPDLEEEEGKQS